ncbi:MAG: DNA polymerase IV [bacterium]|nr:DNA polymerase IV [bacterium]
MIWWAHLDMDSFFASVEIASRPYYKDLPLAVGGNEHSRTVVASASYKAREYGIKSGMPVYEALNRCPHLIIVNPDMDKYVSVSKEVFGLVENLAGNILPYSIDECFFYSKDKEDIILKSLHIKRIVKEKLKITASCGIADKKIVAKMASDERKPDGFFVVKDSLKYIREKDVGDVPGVGRKLKKKLNSLGVYYVKQLDDIPFPILKKHFKQYAYFLKEVATLKVSDNIFVYDEVKSVGNTHTFKKDTLKREEILSYISLICQHIEQRLLEEFFEGNRLTLTFRYSNFQTFTKQRKVERYIYSSEDIFKESSKILDSVNLVMPLRLVGVSLGGIRKRGIYEPLPFFENEKDYRLKECINSIKREFGELSIMKLRDLYVFDRTIRGRGIISRVGDGA